MEVNSLITGIVYKYVRAAAQMHYCVYYVWIPVIRSHILHISYEKRNENETKGTEQST